MMVKPGAFTYNESLLMTRNKKNYNKNNRNKKVSANPKGVRM